MNVDRIKTETRRLKRVDANAGIGQARDDDVGDERTSLAVALNVTQTDNLELWQHATSIDGGGKVNPTKLCIVYLNCKRHCWKTDKLIEC